MNTAPVLIAAGAAVLGSLGSLHLLYTYRGDKFHPRDPALRAAMERSSLVITRQTSVWRANLGFNASHGLGIVVFAMLYIHLALWRWPLLRESPFLLSLGMAVLLAYLGLAWRYFFSIPRRGMALACALYACGWALA